MMVRFASKDLYQAQKYTSKKEKCSISEKERVELQVTASLCIASVWLGYVVCKSPSIRLFPGPSLVYLVLDLVQLCYLYGHSVRPVMMVVYMEHTSNHLGNNLAKEFLGPHSSTRSCQG